MSHCVPNWGVELSLATHKPPPGVAHVPWYDGHAGGGKAAAPAATARDAVVPCAVFGEDEVEGVQVAPDSEGGCTRVGSCSGPAAWEFSKAGADEGSVNADDARVPVAEEEEGWSGEEGESASLDDMSDTFDGSRRVPTMSSRGRAVSESLTTSFNSLDSSFSSSWRSGTKNTTPSDDNSSSSVFRSRKQRGETDTEERSDKKGTSKSSTKRSRCEQADQSQRKRREKIDQRMNKLQRLVPTSKRQTEEDKEWVLDEVIEHVQKLQAQLHQMMMMTMMMPMPMMPMFQQQLPHMPMMMMPMPMMPLMGMQEGYRQNLAPPACVFPAAYMPAAYPQCHWRPTSAAEEAHSRMAAASLMQHHQQFPFIFQHANFF